MSDKDILLLKIRGMLPSLNPALRKIAQYVLENPFEVKLLRIKDLATRCSVAEATVTRFVKAIGCNSFQEMKISKRTLVSGIIGGANILNMNSVLNIGKRNVEKAREILKEAGLPVIVVSDSPAKKVVKDLEAKGFGYIIVEADSMIGARREFLDPTEMACFNSDIIRVLAVTGVYNLLVRELDKVIQAFKEGKEPELPRFVVDKTKAVEAADLQNPYAKAKAMAAYEAARRVGDLNVEGCFKLQEREAYIPVVATAHELMSYASKLAAEAREIEKYGDTLTRKPHAKDGTLLTKVKLLEKPEKK